MFLLFMKQFIVQNVSANINIQCEIFVRFYKGFLLRRKCNICILYITKKHINIIHGKYIVSSMWTVTSNVLQFWRTAMSRCWSGIRFQFLSISATATHLSFVR